jgi:hypothetical protein
MPDVSLVKHSPVVTAAQKQAAIGDLEQILSLHRVPLDIRAAILQAAR